MNPARGKPPSNVTKAQFEAQIGDKAPVPIAFVGASTLGYNASIVVQCHLRVIK